MGITPGYLTTESCRTINLKRIKSSKRHSTQKWKKNRKIIRAEKKQKNDKNKKKEGTVYKKGGF